MDAVDQAGDFIEEHAAAKLGRCQQVDGCGAPAPRIHRASAGQTPSSETNAAGTAGTTARSPIERVLAVFDAYLDHASLAYEHGFRGCGLLNAAAELPAGDSGRDAVRRHKEQVEQILVADLETAGVADPAGMAEHLSFLLEGAMSRAGLEGRPDRLVTARRMAAAMLDAA